MTSPLRNQVKALSGDTSPIPNRFGSHFTSRSNFEPRGDSDRKGSAKPWAQNERFDRDRLSRDTSASWGDSYRKKEGSMSSPRPRFHTKMGQNPAASPSSYRPNGDADDEDTRIPDGIINFTGPEMPKEELLSRFKDLGAILSPMPIDLELVDQLVSPNPFFPVSFTPPLQAEADARANPPFYIIPRQYANRTRGVRNQPRDPTWSQRGGARPISGVDPRRDRRKTRDDERGFDDYDDGTDPALEGLGKPRMGSRNTSQPSPLMGGMLSPGVVPQLTGQWATTWGPDTTTITQHGDMVSFVNPDQNWSPAEGHIVGPTIHALGLRGTITKNGSLIDWDNGAIWLKTGGSGAATTAHAIETGFIKPGTPVSIQPVPGPLQIPLRSPGTISHAGPDSARMEGFGLDPFSARGIHPEQSYPGGGGKPPRQWFYKDPKGNIQGPFSDTEMRTWYDEGFFTLDLEVRQGTQGFLTPLGALFRQGDPAFLPALPKFSPPLPALAGMGISIGPMAGSPLNAAPSLWNPNAEPSPQNVDLATPFSRMQLRDPQFGFGGVKPAIPGLGPVPGSPGIAPMHFGPKRSQTPVLVPENVAFALGSAPLPGQGFQQGQQGPQGSLWAGPAPTRPELPWGYPGNSPNAGAADQAHFNDPRGSGSRPAEPASQGAFIQFPDGGAPWSSQNNGPQQPLVGQHVQFRQLPESNHEVPQHEAHEQYGAGELNEEVWNRAQAGVQSPAQAVHPPEPSPAASQLPVQEDQTKKAKTKKPKDEQSPEKTKKAPAPTEPQNDAGGKWQVSGPAKQPNKSPAAKTTKTATATVAAPSAAAPVPTPAAAPSPSAASNPNLVASQSGASAVVVLPPGSGVVLPSTTAPWAGKDKSKKTASGKSLLMIQEEEQRKAERDAQDAELARRHAEVEQAARVYSMAALVSGKGKTAPLSGRANAPAKSFAEIQAEQARFDEEEEEYHPEGVPRARPDDDNRIFEEDAQGPYYAPSQPKKTPTAQSAGSKSTVWAKPSAAPLDLRSIQAMEEEAERERRAKQAQFQQQAQQSAVPVGGRWAVAPPTVAKPNLNSQFPPLGAAPLPDLSSGPKPQPQAQKKPEPIPAPSPVQPQPAKTPQKPQAQATAKPSAQPAQPKPAPSLAPAPAPAPKPQLQPQLPQPPLPSPSKANKAKKKGGSGNVFGGPTMSPEFEQWCRQELQTLSGSSDLTLVHYLMTVEDAEQVKEYVLQYLGNQPAVHTFANTFITNRQFDNGKGAASPINVSPAKPPATANVGAYAALTQTGQDPLAGEKKKSRR